MHNTLPPLLLQLIAWYLGQKINLLCKHSVFSYPVQHNLFTLESKDETIPLQALTGPEGSRRLRLSDYNNRHMKVARLSALYTDCFCTQEIFLVIISVRG
jgi:hypothetical protein